MTKTAFAALLLTASLTLTQSVAHAADPNVPAFDWSGAYAGLTLGADIVDFNSDVFIPAASNMNGAARATYEGAANFSDAGVGLLAGLTAGANMQSNNLVFGLEGDISYLFANPSASNNFAAGETANVENMLDDGLLATLRGRAGLAHGNSLFYLTGGLAYSGSDVKHTMDWSFADGCPPAGGGLQRCHVGDSGDLGLGWTLGVGIEHAISQSMTLKAEYLYADFKDQDIETVNAAVANQNALHSIDADMHVVRFGLNWHY
jgi:outer membrane immunogenic protein